MRLTCPCCASEFPIEAGLIEADGKRLAAQLGNMEPVLARAVLGYLRLFKPAKHGLRMARASKLIAELEALIRTGQVCRDERTGVHRPATPAMWATGIEHMLANPPSGPLQNHHYLRAVVFALADKADAQAERAREDAARQGRHRSASNPAPQRLAPDPVQVAIDYANHMHHLGAWTDEQRDSHITKARNKAREAP